MNPTIEKGPWEPEEEKLIFQLQARVGNAWTDISRFLPGRSEASVKNRYYSALRRVERAHRVTGTVAAELVHDFARKSLEDEEIPGLNEMVVEIKDAQRARELSAASGGVGGGTYNASAIAASALPIYASGSAAVGAGTVAGSGAGAKVGVVPKPATDVGSGASSVKLGLPIVADTLFVPSFLNARVAQSTPSVTAVGQAVIPVPLRLGIARASCESARTDSDALFGSATARSAGAGTGAGASSHVRAPVATTSLLKGDAAAFVTASVIMRTPKPQPSRASYVPRGRSLRGHTDGSLRRGPHRSSRSRIRYREVDTDDEEEMSIIEEDDDTVEDSRQSEGARQGPRVRIFPPACSHVNVSSLRSIAPLAPTASAIKFSGGGAGAGADSFAAPQTFSFLYAGASQGSALSDGRVHSPRALAFSSVDFPFRSLPHQLDGNDCGLYGSLPASARVESQFYSVVCGGGALLGHSLSTPVSPKSTS